MPIFPQGSINLAALSVPNVYVQIQPPMPLVNGVETDILVVVGTATWGAKNSPVVVGSAQDLTQSFGSPQALKYDLGTAVSCAMLMGASNFRCIRVTDGTDTAASGTLLDTGSVPSIGAYLTGIYTGSLGNTINAVIGIGSAYTASAPTYKLTIYMNSGIPEVFDNIGGTGITFWQNLVSAVNNGQSVARGPSQLVIASLGTGIGSVAVTSAGSGYTSVPTVTASIGTGATFQATLKAVSAAVQGSGSGYAVGDTITLAGGTFTTAIVITVTSVSSGAITEFTISTAGSYTAIASNPLSQNSTSGSGTGATFNVTWGVNAISVLTHGNNYTSATAITISGSSGATATASIGAQSAPSQTTTTLSGGTSGNTPGSSNVTTQTLIGSDSANPRTGMYAARKAVTAGVIILADADDSTYWANQDAFAKTEACYCVGTIAPGYQDNISGAATLLQSAGVNSYYFALMHGDWIQINDTYNNVTRYVSPQSFKAGMLVALAPSESSLNKPMNGIIATQKTSEGRVYSDADLSFLRNSRIDLITNPIPYGNSYGVRFGVNTSSNALQQTDNYPRLVNFIGATLLQAMGPYVGKNMSPTVLSQINSVASGFLQNLVGLEYINNFKLILDASNNPSSRTALGYLQANAIVYAFPIILYLIVNLDVEQNATIQAQTPQFATPQLVSSIFGG